MKTEHKYYGQHGDDYLLWQLFGNKKNGFFIDVGAFDGIHLSNSYSFEQAGWNGICVEALPDMFSLCKKNRSNTICVEAACVGNDDLQEIEFTVEKLGLLSGVNVNSKEEDVRSRYARRGIAFEGFDKISVTARTLNSILNEYVTPDQEIDFVSIDVEGSEIDVLNGFDLQRYTPRCIVVEANDDEHYAALFQYLVDKNGYFLARRLGCNLFFVHDNKDIDTLKNAPINCRIEPTVHPSGKEYTLRDHVEGKYINSSGNFVKRIFKRILRG